MLLEQIRRHMCRNCSNGQISYIPHMDRNPCHSRARYSPRTSFVLQICSSLEWYVRCSCLYLQYRNMCNGTVVHHVANPKSVLNYFRQSLGIHFWFESVNV